MRKTNTTFFRIAMVVYLIVLGVLCFVNFGSMDNVPKKLFGFRFDMVVHFLMFLPFPILAYLCIRPVSGCWRKLALMVAVFAAGCLVAAGTEIGQGLLPYRSKDIKDFYADMTALGAGSILTLIVSLIIDRK